MCGIYDTIYFVMGKECYITGKTTSFGNSRKHQYGGGWEYRAPATKRKWKPNLRRLKIVEDGTPKTVWVSMKFYKKIKAEALA
jgi:large subunit ribosomal protein L28